MCLWLYIQSIRWCCIVQISTTVIMLPYRNPTWVVRNASAFCLGFAREGLQDIPFQMSPRATLYRGQYVTGEPQVQRACFRAFISNYHIYGGQRKAIQCLCEDSTMFVWRIVVASKQYLLKVMHYCYWTLITCLSNTTCTVSCPLGLPQCHSRHRRILLDTSWTKTITRFHLSCRMKNDYTLITNLMHWLLFIHKIPFSSTCFEHQVLIFRRT